MAQDHIVAEDQTHRINLVPVNVRSLDLLFPKADAIWMSLFLVCFSEEEIVNILKHSTKKYGCADRFVYYEDILGQSEISGCCIFIGSNFTLQQWPTETVKCTA